MSDVETPSVQVDGQEAPEAVEAPKATPTSQLPQLPQGQQQSPQGQPGQQQPNMQELNNEISRMTGEFNQRLQNINVLRSKLSAVQAKSLSGALRLAKTSGAEHDAIEKSLNLNLLDVSDARDALVAAQDELIEMSILLFRTKDMFTQQVTQARVQFEQARQQQERKSPCGRHPPVAAHTQLR